MNLNKIRISVIDDHPVVILGIQAIISKKKQLFDFCKNYSNSLEALVDLADNPVDVLLIDIKPGDKDAVETIEKIRLTHHEIKIGIFSDIEDEIIILKAMERGCLGYLPKTADIDTFLDFVSKLSRGEQYYSNRFMQMLIESSRRTNRAITTIVNLTGREKEILEFVLGGLKNQQIAEKLSISERTVEFHKQNIFSKYKVTDTKTLFKVFMDMKRV